MRKRYDSLYGTITDNPLTIGATTMNSAALASLPAIAAPNYAALVLDPTEVGGDHEIVWVMAHTASATSATIWRGREASTARAHLNATRWVHGPTVRDLDLHARPHVFQPPGWDDTWIQAKYNIQTTPAFVAATGESIVLGMTSTDWDLNSYFGKIRTNLLTTMAYPKYGDYYHLGSYQTFVGATNPYTQQAGGTLYQGGYPTGSSVIWTNPVTNPIITFVAPYAVTALDIIYTDYTAGNFVYTVDGGANNTVTLVGGNKLKRVALTGLSNAVHTIRFTTQNASNVMMIDGIALYDPTNNKTKGFGFAKIGVIGGRASDLVRDDLIIADKPTLWQGSDGAAIKTGFGFPTPPSLFILELGGNDLDHALVGTAPFLANTEIYRDGVSRLIEALRFGKDNCSILIHAAALPGPVSSDQTTSVTGWENYPALVGTMHAVAIEFGCAFVNTHARWGRNPVADGYTIASDVHPTNAGHLEIANLLIELVGN